MRHPQVKCLRSRVALALKCNMEARPRRLPFFSLALERDEHLLAAHEAKPRHVDRRGGDLAKIEPRCPDAIAQVGAIVSNMIELSKVPIACTLGCNVRFS